MEKYLDEIQLPTITSLDEIFEYYEKIPKEEYSSLTNKLKNKWNHLCTEVDLFAFVDLLFLLVIDVLETRGRGDRSSCIIAQTCLQKIYAQYKNSLDNYVVYCDPFLEHTPHIAINYPCLPYKSVVKDLVNQVRHARATNRLPVAADGKWFIGYLIIHAIYHKDERMEGTWVEAVESFYDNSDFEYIMLKVPGISFYDKGVRHDMLCPVSGTADPDFFYEPAPGKKYTAEFKRPTVNVDRLAQYGLDNPKYIYYVDYLFTYGARDTGKVGFFKIDYTNKYSYTIEEVLVDSELLNQIKEMSDK